MEVKKTALLLSFVLILSACGTRDLPKEAVYTGVGATAGAGIAGLLGVPKAMTLVSVLLGGGIGYYVSLPHIEPASLKEADGKAFQVGSSIIIVIPTDAIFEPATATFTDDSDVVLSDVADVLNNYPNKNILITANTAKISSPDFADRISTLQAEKVTRFFEAHGVHKGSREVQFAGLGSREPIANTRSAKGIYENRRIQITLYAQEAATPPKHDNVGVGQVKHL